jgi:hypothetical protein
VFRFVWVRLRRSWSGVVVRGTRIRLHAMSQILDGNGRTLRIVTLVAVARCSLSIPRTVDGNATAESRRSTCPGQCPGLCASWRRTDGNVRERECADGLSCRDDDEMTADDNNIPIVFPEPAGKRANGPPPTRGNRAQSHPRDTSAQRKSPMRRG